MRASTAYFAGAGTVIAAIAGGVGGGLLFADIVSPQTPKQELTRLEQRMSAQPIQVKTGSEPAATSAAPPPTTAAAPAIPAPEQPPAQNTAAAPAPAERVQAQNVISPAAASTAEAPAATQPPAAPAPSEPKASPPAQKQAATVPEDSLAKARDVDIKRAATEKRRTERRQQWSEKRRTQQRQDPDQELREVEQKVRQETETRPIFASEPARAEMPRIRLFDLD
jgi:hypothetical protein